jgi:hypothetical protein
MDLPEAKDIALEVKLGSCPFENELEKNKPANYLRKARQ